MINITLNNYSLEPSNPLTKTVNSFFQEKYGKDTLQVYEEGIEELEETYENAKKALSGTGETLKNTGKKAAKYGGIVSLVGALTFGLGALTFGSVTGVKAEDNNYSVGAGLEIVNTELTGIYEETNKTGNDLTDSWDDVSLEKSTSVAPTLILESDVYEDQDRTISIIGQLGPKTSMSTTKSDTYKDADIGFGETEADVNYQAEADITEASGGVELGQDIGEIVGSEEDEIYANIQGSWYRVDFSSENRMVIPAENLQITDNIDAEGSSMGYRFGTGFKANISEDLSAKIGIFRSNSSVDLSGTEWRNTSNRGRNEKEFNEEGNISENGVKADITYKF